jgi:hypothetical protein
VVSKSPSPESSLMPATKPDGNSSLQQLSPLPTRLHRPSRSTVLLRSAQQSINHPLPSEKVQTFRSVENLIATTLTATLPLKAHTQLPTETRRNAGLPLDRGDSAAACNTLVRLPVLRTTPNGFLQLSLSSHRIAPYLTKEITQDCTPHFTSFGLTTLLSATLDNNT